MEFYKEYPDLYILHYNKWYKVVALFTNINDSNKYMEEHENASVLKTSGNIIVLVDKNDKGVHTIEITH